MEDYAIICNPLAGKQQKGKRPIEFASEYLDNFNTYLINYLIQNMQDML